MRRVHVLLLTVLIFASSCSSTPVEEVRVAEVTRGDIEEAVTAQGKLEPRTFVDVGTQVTGQLRKIYVDYGALVKAGDLLAEIDPRLYQARVDAGAASIKNLQAQVMEQEASGILARQRLNRERLLFNERATSQQILQEVTASVAVVTARIAALKAQIEQIESTLSGDRANLGFTKIHAPIDGVVVNLLAREGQTLNANQTTPTILTLADLDTMTVRVQVAEADVFRLSPSMEVFFSPTGSMDTRWKSSIRQILPSPEVVNEVVLYNVLVDAENKDRKLLNGMTAQVFFIVGRAENTALLPIEALGIRQPEHDNPRGKAYAVSTLLSDSIEKKIVITGLNDRRVVQIIDGLKEGDKIAIERREPAKVGSSGNWARNRAPRL